MQQVVGWKDIVLRDYQEAAVEAVRERIRSGKKRIILCAGTGAGKTVIASHLLDQADHKGSYALFLVDRITLVNQTSATLDSYGIRHGVLQGIHQRYAPRENVQVCSIQTLARRRLPRDPDLIVYDECHAQYKSTLDYMAKYPEAIKIGLTATPFTKGMGQHWEDMVNVIPTRRLISEGHLIEPTMYVAKSPDDKDLGINSFGEFSDESASEAGIKIVGDVVAEWMKKTHEHFGKPVKTIVFSPTVAHGRELCAAFAAAGFNFQQVSYLDRSDDERAEKIEEFRRPDSVIHGLVSCGVLTKGFDVPDCLIGISCKPYRKSLSSHMQEVGRIMRPAPGKTKALWLCLARDSRVLTDRGLVPIQLVTKHHKVWDGENFVSHSGAICKGVQNVITYHGLTATPGHLVHTAQGWRTFGDCAREQIAITQTGFGGHPVRIGKDHLAGRSLAGPATSTVYSRRLRVRDLSISLSRLARQLAGWTHQRLSCLQPTAAGVSGLALCASSGAEASVRQSKQQTVSELWGSRDQVPLRGCEGRDALDSGKSGHPRGLRVQGFRSDRRERSLRAGQHPVVSEPNELAEQAWKPSDSKVASVPAGASRSEVFRRLAQAASVAGNVIRGNRVAVSKEIGQAQREVWDILDAGPCHRFTCEGLLVHNCHSGNLERFAPDMAEVWDRGAGPLDQAEKHDAKKRERNAETREAVVCQECSGVMRGTTCTACGWERPSRSNIVAVEGELVEFRGLNTRLTPRPGLHAECLSDSRAVWNAALAYTFLNTRKGQDVARKWAYSIFRGVYPTGKLPRGWYDLQPENYRADAYALIEREVRRYRKGKRAA